MVATSCKLSGSYLHPPEVCRVLFYSAFRFTERGHLNTIHSTLLKCTKDIKLYLLFIENILSAKIIFSEYFREEKQHKNCIQIANCCTGLLTFVTFVTLVTWTCHVSRAAWLPWELSHHGSGNKRSQMYQQWQEKMSGKTEQWLVWWLETTKIK